jgi:hypothetical protein
MKTLKYRRNFLTYIVLYIYSCMSRCEFVMREKSKQPVLVAGKSKQPVLAFHLQ